MDPITGALTALPTSSSPPSPTFNATTSTCSHLVHQAIFTFVYNPSGSLQASTPVQLSLVLADATLPAPTDPDPLFLQRIKVSWVPTGLAGSVPEAFSGNPGYIPSYPVLAGVVVTDPQLATTTAVQRYFEGFPVPTAGAGGLCSARASMPLRYGTNATSSCHVRLTAAELQSWCGQGAGGIAAALVGGIYSDLVAAKVVLGVWGNSVHTDVAQWIQVRSPNCEYSAITWLQGWGACSWGWVPGRTVLVYPCGGGMAVACGLLAPDAVLLKALDQGSSSAVQHPLANCTTAPLLATPWE